MINISLVLLSAFVSCRNTMLDELKITSYCYKLALARSS